jgi:hypothetical protein
MSRFLHLVRWPRIRDILLVAVAAHDILDVASSWLALAVAIGFAGLLTAAIADTAKTRVTEDRVSTLVSSLGTTNQALSGQATTTASPAGVPTGGPTVNSTSTNGLSGPSITGTSGPQSGGAAAHTHSAGSYSILSGQHSHDLQGHGHDFDGHTHNLPTIP